MSVMPGFMANEMLGEKVIEMADRVAGLDKVVPGSHASWIFELDGTEFEIVMCVKRDNGRVASRRRGIAHETPPQVSHRRINPHSSINYLIPDYRGDDEMSAFAQKLSPVTVWMQG